MAEVLDKRLHGAIERLRKLAAGEAASAYPLNGLYSIANDRMVVCDAYLCERLPGTVGKGGKLEALRTKQDEFATRNSD